MPRMAVRPAEVTQRPAEATQPAAEATYPETQPLAAMRPAAAVELATLLVAVKGSADSTAVGWEPWRLAAAEGAAAIVAVMGLADSEEADWG